MVILVSSSMTEDEVGTQELQALLKRSQGNLVSHAGQLDQTSSSMSVSCITGSAAGMRFISRLRFGAGAEAPAYSGTLDQPYHQHAAQASLHSPDGLLCCWSASSRDLSAGCSPRLSGGLPSAAHGKSQAAALSCGGLSCSRSAAASAPAD